jgi:putative membrane protein
MFGSAVLAFIHHLAAFTLFASILFQHLTFKRDISVASAKRLLIVDTLYGLSALIVLAVGFIRVLYFEKGPEFYGHNAFYWVKIGAFVIAGLLSIYPTLTFFSWRAPLKQNILPPLMRTKFNTITWMLRGQMLCLLIILFAAAMMARGIGMME